MKKILVFLLTIVGLLGCQPTKKQSILPNGTLIFDEKVSIDVKEINFIPRYILGYNYVIRNKIDSYNDIINKIETEDLSYLSAPPQLKNFLLLEIVFNVTQTKEKTIYIQDYFNFEVIADIKSEGTICEEKWKDGLLILEDTYKTFLDNKQTKKMRMYFCIPEEFIFEKEIIIKEKNSNQLFCINADNVNNNGWTELGIGDVIESENYSITINGTVEKDSQIDPELEKYIDTKFYGLNVTIENKTSKSLYTGNCIQNTFMYDKYYNSSGADQYMVINLKDVLTEDDVTREFVRIDPNGKVNLVFGFTWSKEPIEFLFLQNQNFYHIKTINKD